MKFKYRQPNDEAAIAQLHALVAQIQQTELWRRVHAWHRRHLPVLDCAHERPTTTETESEGYLDTETTETECRELETMGQPYA